MWRTSLRAAFVLALTLTVFGNVLAGQEGVPDSTLLINYFSKNYDGLPDTFLRIANTGQLLTGPILANGNLGGTGNMCANIYVYDSDQTMAACCSCYLTADGLRFISVRSALTIYPLRAPLRPANGIIKIVGSPLPAGATGAACDPSTYTDESSGLKAWGTHLQDPVPAGAPDAGVWVQTETEFSPAVLTQPALDDLQNGCWYLRFFGSGVGVCGCGAGL